MKFALDLALIGAVLAAAVPDAQSARALGTAAQSLTSPSVVAAIQSPPQQEKKKPVPRDLYDEAADANLVVKAAIARAECDGKRVLLQWGADWCGWCHLLNDAFKQNKDLAHKLLYEYEVVHVDIGKWDKHLELAASFNASFKGAGVPYLTVLDGKGNVLVNSATGLFECPDSGNGLKHDPAKLLAFLTVYEAPKRDSADLYTAALKQAKESQRLVLLTFGAPWCTWCHKFEDWARSEAVATALGKDFVFVKVDIDRTIGGKALLEKLRGPVELGIPWFAFVDGDGTVVATSTTAAGKNLGCPWTPEEKAAFDALLTTHGKRITPEERAAMLALLGDKI